MVAVVYMRDKVPRRTDNVVSYTGNPFLLTWSDLKLLSHILGYIPFVLAPIKGKQKLDELYPTPGNLYDVFFHAILIVVQLAFLLSLVLVLVLGFFIPLGAFVVYFVGFLVLNHLVCYLLNGKAKHFLSNIKFTHGKDHSDEQWIFLNGVAVGHHWLRSNINQLALTFGRNILGVHNPTAGIIFDLIQCIIQRDFDYATEDVRNAYVEVRKALYDPTLKKVVFIVHSQGAIEGGMIIDWLLAEMPQDLMHKLEVYTFGNAANHFNSPRASSFSMASRINSPSLRHGNGNGNGKIPTTERNGLQELLHLDTTPTHTLSSRTDTKAIRHIEHYANNSDLVARWGVLHFTETPPASAESNRFMGRVFERKGTGHLLNQHYLDFMFPLDPSTKTVLEHNPFMDSYVKVDVNGAPLDVVAEITQSVLCEEDVAVQARVLDVGSPVEAIVMEAAWESRVEPKKLKVRDLSRLWLYRNGGSPSDEDRVM